MNRPAGYIPPDAARWTGRVDDLEDRDAFCWQQPFGFHPETVLRLLKHVLASGKVVSFDFAEVSPRFDSDDHTAKLAAVFVYALVSTLAQSWR